MTLVCQATGQPTPTVTWRKAFRQLPKERTAISNSNLTIYRVTKADSGSYACLVRNLLGEDSAVAQVTVIDELKFTLTPKRKVVVWSSSNVFLNWPHRVR